MHLGIFASGVALGFAFSAPIGPVGILCVRTTLTEKRISGLAIGLGAATADALYAALATYGFTLASRILTENQLALRLFGGLLLMAWGLKLILLRRRETTGKPFRKGNGLLGSAILAFIITLTNPATIIAFTVAFSSLAIFGHEEVMNASVLLVGGVFIGAICWWSILTTIATRLKSWITDLGAFNRVCGVLLVVFGVAILARAGYTIVFGA